MSDVYLTVSSLLRAVDRQRLFDRGKQRGVRHSFLPSNYWGSTKDVKFPKLAPHFSFSRSNVEVGRFSLPTFSKGTDKNSVTKYPDIAGHRTSHASKEDSEQLSQNGEKQSSNSGLPEPSKRFLPRSISNRRSGKVASLGAQSLPSAVMVDDYRANGEEGFGFPASVLENTGRSVENFGQSGDADSQQNSGLSRDIVTVHFPDLDGNPGRIALHRTTRNGEVLPPLVSTTCDPHNNDNDNTDDDSRFTYHHQQEDESPNLPRYDSNLSATSGGISREIANIHLQDLRDSPAFHITSISNNTVHSDRQPCDSPMRLYSKGCLYCGGIGGVHKDFCKAVGSGKSLNGAATKMKNASHKSGPDTTIKESRNSGSERYLDSSQSNNNNGKLSKMSKMSDSRTRCSNLSPMTETESSSISFHSYTMGNGLDAINTVIEDLPSDQSFTDEAFLNEAYRKGQEKKKAKVESSLDATADTDLNVHRRAYIAALAVARCRQLPNEPMLLQFRVSRPYQFSYLSHVPHQKPCRCAECREMAISKTISPRKGKKAKKISPMKHIFGSVKIEDYYPKQQLV